MSHVTVAIDDIMLIPLPLSGSANGGGGQDWGGDTRTVDFSQSKHADLRGSQTRASRALFSVEKVSTFWPVAVFLHVE